MIRGDRRGELVDRGGDAAARDEHIPGLEHALPRRLDGGGHGGRNYPVPHRDGVDLDAGEARLVYEPRQPLGR